MDAIVALAEHVVRTRSRDLPPAAVAATKIFLQDTLGVAVAGSAGPWMDEVVGCLRGWGAAEQSSVWVRGVRLPAPAAALANAYQIHNSEFDCVHEGAVVHPMAAVLSAALAQAERQGGVRGDDLVAAVALGVDVACHIGVASTAPLRFFRPATAGGFGATAAVGKLMGFDVDTLVGALGVAYSQMCGTMQAHTEGSILLGLQIGFNARNAVMACDMAARRVPSLRGTLEGPFGYYRLFEGDYDAGRIRSSLGRVWRISEVSHKPFPSGRATHGLVDGLLELRSRHGLAVGDIERVTAAVPPLVHRLVGRPTADRLEPGYARLCGAYVGARALIGGTVGLEDFRPPALTDPATHALARRFTIAPDGNPDPNALGPVTVTVGLRGGGEHGIRVDRVYGSPAKPMSREAHLAKFHRNWAAGARRLDAARGDRLVALIDALESVADVRELVELTWAEGAERE